MQVLIVAPFLLAAGLVFTLLSVFPPWRRWAIPIPTGITAAGPCLIVALILVGVLARLVAPSHPWGGLFADVYLGLAAFGAVVGGVLAGISARFAASLLPFLLLRLTVFVAAWCSYFVLTCAAGFLLNLAAPLRAGGWIAGLVIVVINFTLSFIGAWFTGRSSESFRPARTRMADLLTSFPGPTWLQSRAKRGSPDDLGEVPPNLPVVPPKAADQL